MSYVSFWVGWEGGEIMFTWQGVSIFPIGLMMKISVVLVKESSPHP